MKPGKLYLIPTFLSDSARPDFISSYNNRILSELDEFIVEELRTARRFLRSVGYNRDFNSVNFYELNEHTDQTIIVDYVEPLLKGKDMGLISESGTPCVADPGSEMVLLAHQKKIPVVPLIGPNSIILALMASGLNGQNFIFHGYLPIDKNQRKQTILSMEKDSISKKRTQIFIETPYRNHSLYESLISICSPDLKLCIACNINSTDEFIHTMAIREWKLTKPDIHKKPSVFLLNF
jgi:16S rRNA (cytidine1402-2'-O)-methyltransferase